MDLFDILAGGLLLWFVYKMIKVWAIASAASQLPISFTFPIKLEYTDSQWFAWDNDNEFLGQAATKQDLIERISKELDFPKDKFSIVSEYPMGTNMKGTP